MTGHAEDGYYATGMLCVFTQREITGLYNGEVDHPDSLTNQAHEGVETAHGLQRHVLAMRDSTARAWKHRRKGPHMAEEKMTLGPRPDAPEKQVRFRHVTREGFVGWWGVDKACLCQLKVLLLAVLLGAEHMTESHLPFKCVGLCPQCERSPLDPLKMRNEKTKGLRLTGQNVFARAKCNVPADNNPSSAQAIRALTSSNIARMAHLYLQRFEKFR
ncbi:hypothetical protein B0H11DRAFT_1931277 [Mycena galericulata]|nr:hypothetical protein B0H11DRAFT_1931277 [Mycena galericulata]